jgi:hypothetical protein
VLARRVRNQSIEDRSTADPGLCHLRHDAQGTGLSEKPRRRERSGDRDAAVEQEFLRQGLHSASIDQLSHRLVSDLLAT